LLSSGKLSILIIDDDTAILHAFSRIFQKKGYRVTVAESGKDAIEELGINQFDVALIDLALPDMEGNELFPLIASASPKTLKVMLTGKSMLQENIEGADAFVAKPVNPEKLLSLIDVALENRDTEI
jgi:DNA-binding NtrC family response regulator